MLPTTKINRGLTLIRKLSLLSMPLHLFLTGKLNPSNYTLVITLTIKYKADLKHSMM